MNEDGTKTPTAVDEVAESGEVGKQVLCHAVSARYEIVTVIRDDLLVPGLIPLDPFSIRKRDHGDDVVLLKYFTSTRTFAIAKVKAVVDLGDWWVWARFLRHCDRTGWNGRQKWCGHGGAVMINY